MTAFVSSPRFVEHVTGPHHPERPDRIRAIHRAVRVAGLIDSPDPFPEFQVSLGIEKQSRHKLIELTAIPPDPSLLELIHTPEHIAFVRRMCEYGGGVLDAGDTPVIPISFEIALLSLGSAIVATDAVMRGTARRAFSAARPPGHHAEPDRSLGFCLFSNIAIIAKYIRHAYGVNRIAIVDFDVHHGNGTQTAFEADSDVLFISLHQDPRTCYPGSGRPWETGVGEARGFTLNLPLEPGSGDTEYLHLMDTVVVPRLDEFRPEVLLLSAGFDAHADDPLANIRLTDDGFDFVTRRLCAAADRHCEGKIVSLLEGGYHLRALGRSVVRHLIALES